MKSIAFALIFTTIKFTTYGQEFSLLRQNDDLKMSNIIGSNTMCNNLKNINLFQNTTLNKFVFFELESNVIFPDEFLEISNREDTISFCIDF